MRRRGKIKAAALLIAATLLAGCALLPCVSELPPADLQALRLEQLEAPTEPMQLALMLGSG